MSTTQILCPRPCATCRPLSRPRGRLQAGLLAEALLRDLAFALHAARRVREAMDAEKAELATATE